MTHPTKESANEAFKRVFSAVERAIKNESKRGVDITHLVKLAVNFGETTITAVDSKLQADALLHLYAKIEETLEDTFGDDLPGAIGRVRIERAHRNGETP